MGRKAPSGGAAQKGAFGESGGEARKRSSGSAGGVGRSGRGEELTWGPALTLKYLGFTTVLALSVLVAVALERPEPVLAGAPFLIALAFIGAGRAPSYSITSRLSHERCYEGDVVAVFVDVSTSADVPLLEICHSLCGESGEVLAAKAVALSLRAGETRTLEFQVTLERRGVYTLGCVYARALSPSGSLWHGHRIVRGIRCIAYPRVTPLHLAAKMSGKPRPYGGNYLSRAKGQGVDLAEVREYVPGDDARSINWRVSARMGGVFVNQHYPERNTDVVVVLDSLRDVGRWPNSFLDAGVRAAASIAFHFLQQKDRVGFIDYGGILRWVVPTLGTRQLYMILEKLARAQVVESFTFKDVYAIPSKVLPPRSLVFVITPLLDQRSERMISDLAGRGFDPVVIYVSPVALCDDQIGSSTVESLARRWWDLEQRGKARRLASLGLAVVEWDGRQPLEARLAGVLTALRRRGAAAGAASSTWPARAGKGVGR